MYIISELTELLILSVQFCTKGKITSVNHLKKLIALDCAGSDICQNSISELRNIIFLRAYYNEKITSVNHLENMVELYCERQCGIDKAGISKITKLTSLSASNNEK